MKSTVQQINEKGIKVQGRWYNFSKYDVIPVKPAVGESVELVMDKTNRWIKAVKIIKTPVNHGDESDDGVVLKSHSATASPPRDDNTAMGKKEAVVNVRQDREVTISKLAVLNTAAEILKTRNKPVDSAQVKQTAEELLAWVYSAPATEGIPD